LPPQHFPTQSARTRRRPRRKWCRLLLPSALLPAAAASTSRSSSPSAPPPPLVPAVFVIGGDSTAGVGANNYLGTLARADREPCGRGFGTHRPAGRFSNGRVPVDNLGGLLATSPFSWFLHGLVLVRCWFLDFVRPCRCGSFRFRWGSCDFGCACRGVHVSLTRQVKQVEDTYEQLALALGEAATVNLFKRSVFFLSIRSKDFIHYYLRRCVRRSDALSPMGVQSAPC
uniref:GDSL esterase/lipase n=1 Tax=Aegilops tauschii subsp. strangulata TaxID=200361 RepID=A0A452Z4R6_AEGTS